MAIGHAQESASCNTNMTSSTTAASSDDPSPHVADQAGGEAIFSSDGLAPIPKPPAPKTRHTEDNEKDGLDQESHMDPLKAFEIFAGTVFPNTNGNETSTSSAATMKCRPFGESRLESLARIESELKALEMDLDVSKSGEPTEDPNLQAEQDLMQQLSQRLVQLSTTVSSNVEQRHLDLNSIVQSQVQQLKDTEQGSDQPKKDEIVYELYSKNDNGTAMTPQQLERLERLEQCLGPVSNGGISSSTLLERLAKAEDTLKSIHPTSLELAASRAKVIR